MLLPFHRDHTIFQFQSFSLQHITRSFWFSEEDECLLIQTASYYGDNPNDLEMTLCIHIHFYMYFHVIMFLHFENVYLV